MRLFTMTICVLGLAAFLLGKGLATVDNKIYLSHNFLADDLIECKALTARDMEVYINGELVTCIPRNDGAVTLRWKGGK